MTENMKNFLAKVSEDKSLAERASKLEKAELILLAKELGVELNEADFAQPEGEISEGELTSVTGGAACYCVLGGGGKSDSDDGVCACVAYGQGDVADTSRFCDKRGKPRCVCVAGGGGVTAEEWGADTLH